jgi:hypothetical protein
MHPLQVPGILLATSTSIYSKIQVSSRNGATLLSTALSQQINRAIQYNRVHELVRARVSTLQEATDGRVHSARSEGVA